MEHQYLPVRDFYNASSDLLFQGSLSFVMNKSYFRMTFAISNIIYLLYVNGYIKTIVVNLGNLIYTRTRWLFSSKNRLSKWSSPTFEIFLLGPNSKRVGYLDDD